MSKPTLLGISGSLRKDATNRWLIREAARAFGEATFIEADLNLPLFDGDLQDALGIPEPVQRLADQIKTADAVVISTPEYNKGPSGVLKNALDWVSRTKGGPWRDKPVAVMSAAAGRAGGERAQTMLRAMLNPFRPRVLPGPEVMVGDNSNQFDENGRLINNLNLAALEELMGLLRAEIAAPSAAGGQAA